MHCLDVVTGAVIWEKNLGEACEVGTMQCRPSPLIEGGLLNLIRARLAPAGYRELSRAYLLNPTTPFGGHKFAWAAPSYANGRVFARSDEELVCADLRMAKDQ